MTGDWTMCPNGGGGLGWRVTGIQGQTVVRPLMSLVQIVGFCAS